MSIMCLHFSICFAYLTSIATTVALIVSVMCGEIYIAGIIRHTKILASNPIYLYKDSNVLNALVRDLAVSLVCLVAGSVALISFIFSVMLCNGIGKRQPGQVKAYLAFGVSLAALVGIAACSHMYAYDPEPARNALIASGVYVICLGVVRVVYKNMLQAV